MHRRIGAAVGLPYIPREVINHIKCIITLLGPLSPNSENPSLIFLSGHILTQVIKLLRFANFSVF